MDLSELKEAVVCSVAMGKAERGRLSLDLCFFIRIPFSERDRGDQSPRPPAKGHPWNPFF
ncbi:hypothetical protein CCP2SC5_300020 [Azospirillaceae bacterium]